MSKLHLLVVSVLPICLNVYAQTGRTHKGPSLCLETKVEFDTSSLEKIYLRTEEILADADSFWETDAAYKLVGKWHANNKIPVPLETWKKKMSEISKVPAEERETQPPILVAKEILSNRAKYLRYGIPFVCSFLPATTTTLDTRIYFTAETVARSFMTKGNIVVNVTATYWGKEAGIILNNLVHELFHIGYGFARSHRTEIELDNSQLYSMIDALQNEGIATYVGYEALSIFPTKIERDYELLGSGSDFQRLLSELNDLFSQAESLNPDELRKKAWDVGVVRRAYYIVGAVMARTIDEKRGREALVDTIEVGPRNFSSSYNSLVGEDRRIFEFRLPENLTAMQKLKQAYVTGDRAEARRLRGDMTSNVADLDPSLENKINSLGYMMLGQKRYGDAIDLFKLNVSLFPSSSNTYDSLGEAFLKKGNKRLALRNYRKALELNPDNSNARDMIDRLEKGQVEFKN